MPVAALLVGAHRGHQQAIAERHASDAARRIALDEGVKTISIRTLPDDVRTQDLVGPAGAEPNNGLRGDEQLFYTVLFENDPVFASARIFCTPRTMKWTKAIHRQT